jgi:hypothetical protein
MPENYLVIVTDEIDESTEANSRQRGIAEGIRQKVSKFKEVKLPVEQLEQNMNQFLQSIGRLFKQADRQIGLESNMKLDEVELSVEISGEGEFKLVAGGKAAAKGIIKLKFKRTEV